MLKNLFPFLSKSTSAPSELSLLYMHVSITINGIVSTQIHIFFAPKHSWTSFVFKTQVHFDSDKKAVKSDYYYAPPMLAIEELKSLTCCLWRKSYKLF